jgi:hypothetical protein
VDELVELASRFDAETARLAALGPDQPASAADFVAWVMASPQGRPPGRPPGAIDGNASAHLRRSAAQRERRRREQRQRLELVA